MDSLVLLNSAKIFFALLLCFILSTFLTSLEKSLISLQAEDRFLFRLKHVILSLSAFLR